MPGGAHGMGVGQVAIWELAICLLRGLIVGQGRLDLQAIAHFYCLWYRSKPLEVEYTCSVASFLSLSCIQQAKHFNSSLMRIAPMGVWSRNLSDSEAALTARIETSLTHSHPVILHAGAAYVLALKHLINHLETGRAPIKWLGSMRLLKEIVIFRTNHEMDWAKVAFAIAFRCLREGKRYEESVWKALEMNGDYCRGTNRSS